jgi:hypothetical protein
MMRVAITYACLPNSRRSPVGPVVAERGSWGPQRRGEGREQGVSSHAPLPNGQSCIEVERGQREGATFPGFSC